MNIDNQSRLPILLATLFVALGILLLILLYPSSEDVIEIRDSGVTGALESSVKTSDTEPRWERPRGGGGAHEPGGRGGGGEEDERARPVAVTSTIAFGGRVVEDHTGRPIPGARIRAWTGSIGFPPHQDFPNEETASARTDETGAFHLRGLPRGQSFIVTAQAPGFEHGRFIEYDEKDRRGFLIRLRPGCRLRGRVIDEAGKSVRGALVFVFHFDDADLSFSERPMEDLIRAPLPSLETFAQSVTDQAGRYEIDSVHPGSDGSFWVAAHGPGGGRGIAEASEDPEHPGGFLADVRIPGCASLFLFARLPDGTPQDSGRVYLFSPLRKPLLDQLGNPRGGETGEDGRLTISSLPEGRFHVHLWPEDCRPVAREVLLERGKTTRLVIDLESGLSLEGVVVDRSGKPVAEADVTANPGGNGAIDWQGLTLSGGAFTASCRSGKEGRFRLNSLAPGTMRITAKHEHFCHKRVTMTLGGNALLRITLARHPRITGVVPGFRGRRKTRIRIDPVRGGAYGTAPYPLDSEGRFTFSWTFQDDSADDEHGLVLFIHVPGWPTTRCGPFRPGPGEVIDLGTLKRPVTRIVTGRVLDPGGEPVPDALVEFSVPWYLFVKKTTTDGDGEFTLHDLPLWEGWITAHFEELPPEPLWISDSETGPLDFRLVEGSVIEGRVVNRAGSGRGSIDVRIRPVGQYGDDDPRAVMVETDSQGFFRAAPMRPGTYGIFVRPGALTWAREEEKETPGPVIQIEGGEKRTVEIILDP
ncbi:MAG: carboxypeptidase regulatory-like domain-containing protein [Planctomycetota bacterium]|jgi:protocatechuate 3,4-dioxygenase beta subunit